MGIMGRTRAVALAGSVGALAILAAPAQATVYASTVIASGLDNPRGLAFGPDGALYIAEAGALNPGGPTVVGAEGEAAFGTSGAITRLFEGTQTRTTVRLIG